MYPGSFQVYWFTPKFNTDKFWKILNYIQSFMQNTENFIQENSLAWRNCTDLDQFNMLQWTWLSIGILQNLDTVAWIVYTDSKINLIYV